jgi:O-6-methylguanine DNA methyltransferase
MSYALAAVAPAARRTEGDYGVVGHAVTFISQQRRAPPGVEAIARFCSVTPEELHRLLRRWARLTGRQFMAAITGDRARLPRGRASVPDTPGLSGPGRLHDQFVTHEAMPPLQIPMGRVSTYSAVAIKIHAPKAARAVGAAIGKNPIAVAAPCHHRQVRRPDRVSLGTDPQMRHARMGSRQGMNGLAQRKGKVLQQPLTATHRGSECRNIAR